MSTKVSDEQTFNFIPSLEVSRSERAHTRVAVGAGVISTLGMAWGAINKNQERKDLAQKLEEFHTVAMPPGDVVEATQREYESARNMSYKAGGISLLAAFSTVLFVRELSKGAAYRRAKKAYLNVKKLEM